MTGTDPTRHDVTVTTAAAHRVILDPTTGTTTRTPLNGVEYGWECTVCFRAEAPHYRARELAQAAADQHANPLTTRDPILEDRHLAVVVQSLTYRVLDLDGQPPAPGLGYGWECLLCERAEAATYTTEQDARLAADRHQRARPGDLLTVNQFLDKLDVAETRVFGILDHDTRQVRAYLLKASADVNNLIHQITGDLPPPPHSRT